MAQTQERKVIIAVDASEQAEHAFTWYLTTIHRPDNYLVLLHVPEVLDGDRNRMVHPTNASWEEALRKELAKVKELEQQYNTKLLENGISGRVKTEQSGKPGETICKIAEDEKATMIVMGTRGLGKVRRTIMGSVSDYVVHHAHCPVIVCRK